MNQLINWKYMGVAMIFAGMMTACGGGNNEKHDNHAKFASTIVDKQTGKPVKNVEISIKLNDKVYKDKTNSKGKYKFFVPVLETEGLDTVVMEIYSNKHKSSSQTYEGLEANSTYGLKAGTGIIKHPINVLKCSDMKKAATLHHLGDDNYGGSYNSRFQISTEGISLSLPFNLTADMIAKYNSIEITFLAKGIQRPNKIELIDKETNQVLQLVRTPNSDSSGKFTPYTLVITNIDSLDAGKYAFKITSAVYSDLGGRDDFEFLNFYAILK